jgi:hypothetical protein
MYVVCLVVCNVRWTLDVRFALTFVTFLPAVDLRAALGDASAGSAAGSVGALLRGLPGLFAGLPGTNRLADFVGIVGVLVVMSGQLVF